MGIPKEFHLTEDGTFNLPNTPTGLGRFVLVADGTFGGGTLTVGVIVESTIGLPVFVALSSVTSLTSGGDRLVECGANMRPAVRLTGSTNPTIGLAVSGAF